MTVEILGINDVGHESGNSGFCEGRDLAWLQATPDIPVWSDWGVTYRDVWILDADNKPIEVFNLTEHDLEDPAAYDALRTLFLDAAGQ